MLDSRVSDLRRSEGFYSSLAEQLGWRELERGWQEGLEAFLEVRKNYLLYEAPK